MAVKQTKLFVSELRIIAETLVSEHCRNILIGAADRLEDTDKVAEFYRKKAEKLGGDHRVWRKRRKICVLSLLPRNQRRASEAETD